MTWYILVVNKEGEISESFEIDKSLRDVLDFLMGVGEEYFLLFDDKRKIFISMVKGYLSDIQRRFGRFTVPTIEYRTLPLRCCDIFMVCSTSSCDTFCLDLPREGFLRIDTTSVPSEDYIFGFSGRYPGRVRGLYEEFRNVFNMGDFYKVLESTVK